jgi:hypothetical protein
MLKARVGSSLSEGSWDGVEVGMVVYVCSEGWGSGGLGVKRRSRKWNCLGHQQSSRWSLGRKDCDDQSPEDGRRDAEDEEGRHR